MTRLREWRFWQAARRFLGITERQPHASEQLVACIGAILGVAVTYGLTRWLALDAVAIIPVLGASAVLIFAMPHSVFAQPWPVLGGNLFSALVGVTCYRYLGDTAMSAALAVGLAILVMHLLRCPHPPGGATALLAVIGSPAIHALGYRYALTPAGINGLIAILAGLAWNNLFPWRRYPVSLMRYERKRTLAAATPVVTEAHVRAAIESLNVVVDTSATEMTEIVQTAIGLAEQQRDAHLPVVVRGHFYSNDMPGQQWSVRQIIDENRSTDPARDIVIYRVVDGRGLNSTGTCTRQEFARWVRSELQSSKADRRE